jgi:hypothetical protein
MGASNQHPSLAHPAIDVPTSVTFDEKGDAKVNLDASALEGMMAHSPGFLTVQVVLNVTKKPLCKNIPDTSIDTDWQTKLKPCAV